MAARSAIINVIFRACQKAARGLVRDFGEVEQLQVSKKGPADFVSTADHRAERVLREELQRARPSFGLLLEETGAVAGSDPDRRWIVDPLDGTTNFLHGIPHFCISVGLEEHGEITAGAVYEPLRDEFYWAEKGAGAFLNDRRLRVSARSRLADGVFATGIPSLRGADHGRFLRQLEAVMAVSAGVRRFGAAALDLAYVASGRCDGFWEEQLSPWDMAAGILLIREAGGYVTDLGGGGDMLSTGTIVAANDHLHAPLAKALKAAV